MPLKTDITLRDVYPNTVPANAVEFKVYDGEATPEDIVVRDVTSQSVVSYLYDVVIYPVIVTDTLDAPAGHVFPGIGDVDFGVVYGPTGVDYTGTLVQPAESDVSLGVQYGAGGTEFEGTAASGGGTAYPPMVMGG